MGFYTYKIILKFTSLLFSQQSQMVSKTGFSPIGQLRELNLRAALVVSGMRTLLHPNLPPTSNFKSLIFPNNKRHMGL